MRITESRLRSIIRSVIKENAMFEYEEEDFDRKNDLALDLSSVFFSLSDCRYYLDNPEYVIDTAGVDKSRVSLNDVVKDMSYSGDLYGSFNISFDFFNKLGYDDQIVIRACEYGDNPYWIGYDESQRLVMLNDPADI